MPDKIEVKTSIAPGLVTQVVGMNTNGVYQEMFRHVIQLQETHIRQALWELGWLAPDRMPAFRAVIANAKAVRAHWAEFGPGHGFDEAMHHLELAIKEMEKEGS